MVRCRLTWFLFCIGVVVTASTDDFAFRSSGAGSGVAVGAHVAHAMVSSGDDSIMNVIQLMKEMLDKSKADGGNDRSAYAKFKCYCDENTEEKTRSAETLSGQIQLLDDEVAKLQADTAKRSAENGELRPMLDDNEAARATAESIRARELASFQADESDLISANGQMEQAIDELIAAGQATSVSSGASLLHLRSSHSSQGSTGGEPRALLSNTVQDALATASAFAAPRQQRSIAVFLQKPFTGQYSSQTGEVIGILKNMRDTFKRNLKSSRAAEQASAEAFGKLAKEKSDSYEKGRATFDMNTAEIGSSDLALSDKKTARDEAESSLESDNAFLRKLGPMCQEKQKSFEARKMTRANEEAAIAQALSVLNSESAADTLSKVDATKEDSSSFLQIARSAKKRQQQHGSDRDRVREQQHLTRSALHLKSKKLARIAALLAQGNPFDKVVDEIVQMIAVIAKEGDADEQQLAWCDSERTETHDQRDQKESHLATVLGQIDSLNSTVNDVETGLKTQLGNLNDELKELRRDKKFEVKARSDENRIYQQDIMHLQEAQDTLKKATETLKKFYSWMQRRMGAHHYDMYEGRDAAGGNLKRLKGATVDELEEACSQDASCSGFNTAGWLKKTIADESKWYSNDESLYVKVFDEVAAALVQTRHGRQNDTRHLQAEEPAPPATWEEGGEDASQKSSATDVLGMLERIEADVKEEMASAHKGEEASQHGFEDMMVDLKSQERAHLNNIARIEQLVVDSEADIESTHVDREKTELEHTKLNRYLEQIKPSCDYMVANIDQRRAGREEESAELKQSMEDLKASDAYHELARQAEAEALGHCASRCMPDSKKASAACMACRAKTSVEQYCAANADNPTCPDMTPAEVE